MNCNLNEHVDTAASPSVDVYLGYCHHSVIHICLSSHSPRQTMTFWDTQPVCTIITSLQQGLLHITLSLCTHTLNRQMSYYCQWKASKDLLYIMSLYDSWSLIIKLLCMFTITTLRNNTDEYTDYKLDEQKNIYSSSRCFYQKQLTNDNDTRINN